MAFRIPKIQWLNATIAGNTSSGNPQITNLTSTASLQAGMHVVGTGVPTGAKILTIDSPTQITLDANASATGTGVSFDFYFEIKFVYPPIEKDGEKLDSKEHVSVSISGVRQTSVDYIEAVRDFKFSFLSETLKNEVDNFMQTHALYGRSFRYFDDQTLTSYIDYELNTLKHTPKKLMGKGVDVYVWEVPLVFRRVI